MEVKNRDPDRWKYDITGNIIFKPFTNCKGALCYHYDHIIPYSKGGKTELANCQILQSSLNQKKSNKILTREELEDLSLRNIYLTQKEMDFLEETFYGNVNKVL